MYTLDEEFNKWYEANTGIESKPHPKRILDWFKSYLKGFLESVKLEERKIKEGSDLPNLDYDFTEYDVDYSYNSAIRNQQAKIAEELKNRGIEPN